MDMRTYMTRSAKTDVRPDKSDPIYPLLGLAGEIGGLIAAYKKQVRARGTYEGFGGQVREELGDVLWYVAALARTMNLSLDEIAENNLLKTGQSFGTRLPPAARYDAGFPASQRFPRRFRVSFVPRTKDGVKRVSLFLGDEAVGDPLDDNAYEEDQ